jgi:hypothetical protein
MGRRTLHSLEATKLVIEMTHPASVLQRNSELDSFLFAPVGEDRKGMTVSVVSALARLGFDPREEATELAQLPRDAARRKLAAEVATLPDVPSARAEPGTIAARLVSLLPSPRQVTPAGMTFGHAAAGRPAMMRYFLLWGLLMAMSLAGQAFFAANRAQPPQSGAAPISSTAAIPAHSALPARPPAALTR